MNLAAPRGLSPGVYYRREDYLGIWRRTLIEVVDICAVVVLCVLIAIPVFFLVPDEEKAVGLTLASWPFIWFAYFVLLKGSTVRTLGYVVGSARLVDLHGQPPSMLTLCLRFFFSLLAPATLVVDLLWIGGDRHRQALRDKFAHTYVVRRAATPVGNGPVVYADYSILGGRFLFPEVRVPEENGAP